MIEFHFKHTDFQSLLKDLASQLGNEISNGTLYFKPAQGEGFVHAYNLPNGLSILISRNLLDFDVYLHRGSSPTYYYILNFDEIFIRHKYVDIINTHQSGYVPPIFSGAYLNTSEFDRVTINTRGNTMRIVKCMFTEEWMEKYTGMKKEDPVLKEYLALRSKNMNFEPLDSEYRMLIDEIFEASPDNPMFPTITENRVMLLIEKFFTRTFFKPSSAQKGQFSAKDVHRLMEVEQELIRDFSKSPPTVEELAHKHSIGVSKLKRQFKQVYGRPVFEYYQKYKMEKAKELLLSGQYAVKEVGYLLGYQNLSNFANAFKKEFGVLPSTLLK